MKGSEKAIFAGIGVLALAAAFYLMILSPKREKASELKDQATELEASVSDLNQQADLGQQARDHYPVYYGRLVVLGKAVPDQADSASMIVELSSIANRTHVDFRGLNLGTGGASAGSGSSSASTATPPATSAASTGSTSSGATSSGGTSTTSPTSTTGTPSTTPGSSPTTGSSTSTGSTAATGSSTPATAASAVPATEAAASALPIGAQVGSAGLATLPYELKFKGGFFDVANFIGGVDNLVGAQNGSQVAANGRLMTVDGFALEGGAPGSNPTLDASFLVTTYVTPATQGLTAGATPSGPAPSVPGTGQAPTTPASATTGSVTP